MPLIICRVEHPRNNKMKTIKLFITLLCIGILLFPIYVILFYLKSKYNLIFSFDYNPNLMGYLFNLGSIFNLLLVFLILYVFFKKKYIEPFFKITILFSMSVWIYLWCFDSLKIITTVLD